MSHKNKIYDCFTFFNENLLVNSRFEILKDVVDYFVVCESKYDHKGKKKKINFRLLNTEYKDKIRHIVIEENFPNIEKIPWGKFEEVDLIINATSVGLKREDNLNLNYDKFGKNKFFYDVIYNPRMTNFLKEAKKNNHNTHVRRKNK